MRHAPVAPRVIRPWSAAWEVTRDIPRISVPQNQLDPGAGAGATATRWLSQIDLPESLQTYGATRLAEAFAGQGSASEHLSQTLSCPAEDFSEATLQILLEKCQISRSASGVLMQDFTRQLQLRQTR